MRKPLRWWRRIRGERRSGLSALSLSVAGSVWRTWLRTAQELARRARDEGRSTTAAATRTPSPSLVPCAPARVSGASGGAGAQESGWSWRRRGERSCSCGSGSGSRLIAGLVASDADADLNSEAGLRAAGALSVQSMPALPAHLLCESLLSGTGDDDRLTDGTEAEEAECTSGEPHLRVSASRSGSGVAHWAALLRLLRERD